MEEREEVERERNVLDAVVEHLDPRDRAEVQLLRAGDSREEWVRYLGVEDMPRQKQQRKVDAEKDRLMKKLKRRVQKMQGGVGIGSEREIEQPVL